MRLTVRDTVPTLQWKRSFQAGDRKEQTAEKERATEKERIAQQNGQQLFRGAVSDKCYF